ADRLHDELSRLAPAECLCPETHADGTATIIGRLAKAPTLTPQPDWTFDAATARSALGRHFGVTTFSGFGFDDAQPCLTAAGALLYYAQDMLKTDLNHVRRLHAYVTGQVLRLDEVTRRSLKLTRTLRDGDRQGSLLAAIDRTTTSMGARMLQD